MNTNLVKIKDITPNESNPRTIRDEAFAKLVKSVKEFPQMLEIRPIVVNKDNVVLGGNMRLRACIEAGLTEVPVIKVTNLTPEQEKEFIIKDNVSGGDWDWDILANEWDGQQLSEWGLEVPAFANQGEAVEDDFEIPETIEIKKNGEKIRSQEK